MSSSHRRSKKTPSLSQEHSAGPDLTTAWRSVGRIRAELREMDHRLDGVGSTNTFSDSNTQTTGGAPTVKLSYGSRQREAGTTSRMPGVSSSGDSGPDGSKASSNHTGARRKVSRLDEKKEGTRRSHQNQQNKATTSSSTSTSASSRGREPLRAKHTHNSQQTQLMNNNHHTHPQHNARGMREDSPKRVDFSKTHQLREVNWDGTYQDSLAYPADDATLTDSRDIRDTNINFLNFSRVPGSVGPSSSSHPSSTSSSAQAASALASRATASSSAFSGNGGVSGGVNNAAAAVANVNNNARSSSSGTSNSSSPFAPPPSVSNSSVNCRGIVLPPATPSSSASSVLSSHHRHTPASSSSSSTDQQHYHHHPQLHHYNDHNYPHHSQVPDVRWTSIGTSHLPSPSSSRAASVGKPAGSSSSSHTSPPRPSSSMGNAASSPEKVKSSTTTKGPKLTQVDLKVTHGSRTSSSGSTRAHRVDPRPSSEDVRRRVEEKWAGSSKHNAATASSAVPFDHRRFTFSEDYPMAESRPPVIGGMRGGIEDTSHGAVGGAPAFNMAGGGSHSPRRPRPMKKAITADLKDDEIMMKLKERLKQQRAMASSSSVSGSNDTSLADSNTSLTPSLPPRNPFGEDAAPFVVGPQRPRKIAAAHPAPGYRGFSTELSEQHQGSGQGRPNTKVSGGVKKKYTTGGGSKRQPQLQPKKHEPEGAAASIRHNPPQAAEQRPKKARLIASSSGDKKSSQSGAKNIITTSSWRAGQELIMKELGLPTAKAKVKSSSTQSGHNQEGSSCRTRGRSPDGAEKKDDRDLVVVDDEEEERENDGASAARGIRCDDPLVNDVVAKSKTLSEDTRNMLQELQLGNANEMTRKDKLSHRPPKRKAPKSSNTNHSELDRHQQPSEKTRHYDTDSVRRFMAKQKMERQKRQQEEKLASQRANKKRQQMMDKLAETQKAKAVASSSAARHMTVTDVDTHKKRKDAKGTSKCNKENTDINDDHDDDSTLTGESEDELTPEATPRGEKEVINKPKPRPRDPVIMDWMNRDAANQSRQHNPTAAVAPLASGAVPGGTTTIEFKGQKLNLDLNSVLDRFSQVVKQRGGAAGGPSVAPSQTKAHHPVPAPRLSGDSSSGAEGAPPFELGTTNAVSRTNEERKQAIMSTALTLQNRLAQERRKIQEIKLEQPNPSHPHSTLAEDYVPRYERIAGSGDSFNVFTSNLPGTQVSSRSRSNREIEEEAASRIQAAYRGHSVRGALNWGLPSGNTFGNRLRGVNKDTRGVPPSEDEGAGGDASDVTSSFSDITVTDASDHSSINNRGNHGNHSNPAAVAGNRRTPQRHRRHVDGSSKVASGGLGHDPTRSTYQHKPATAAYSDMPEPRADPQSVMSIFTRQSKYLAAGSMRADLPTSTMASSVATVTRTTASANTGYLGDQDFTNLKQPVITHTSETIHTHTASGLPLVASTRYTRFETSIPDNDASSSASESAAAHTRGGVSGSGASKHSQAHSRHASLRSNEASVKADKMSRQGSHKSGRSEPYTLSFESDDDDDDEDEDEATLTASGAQLNPSQSGGQASVKHSAYNRQVSDAGQETDVSQMSEDEPRVVRSKLEGTHHQSHRSTGSRGQGEDQAQGQESGRLSPNSLANKLSAGLTHLESMEESLRHVVGMERARSVAIAQQETVSLAQVLKARQQEHNNELKQLQEQVQQEAQEATQQLEGMRLRPTASALLKKEDNLRPDSRTGTPVSTYRSSPGRQTREELSQSPGNRRVKRSSATASLASVTRASSSSRTPVDRSTTLSVKTAADSSDSSIKSVSDAEGADSHTEAGSVPEEISATPVASSGRSSRRRRKNNDNDDDDGDASYSMSFDESVTDEESFRQVLPSESHRKEVQQQELNNISMNLDGSLNLSKEGDMSSMFQGDNSFSKFTTDMVRQIIREEEYRSQHQAALLNLREKALREKAKAELAWLEQLKKKPADKRADDAFPNIDKREKKIRQNLHEQQAEIRRLQEANKQASHERQKLLQQHEEIARIKETTNATLSKLKEEMESKGRLGRPSEVHTEDELEVSDASEDHKDSKSDSEMYKDISPSKKSKAESSSIERQGKLRLDQKFMTAREQKLFDRKKQATELLKWKEKLDAEEMKIYKLERKAMDAWGTKGIKDKREKEKSPKKAATPTKPTTHSPPKRATAATADDVSTAAISEHLSSAHDDTIRKDNSKGAESSRKAGKAAASNAAKGRQQTVQGSISEVISTQLSLSQSDSDTNVKSKTKTSVIASATGATATATGEPRKSKQRGQTTTTATTTTASGSESSIPEEVPSGEDKKKAHDSSDDTLINSSANDDYADTFEHDVTAASAASLANQSQRKKSPVGKLLPQGNSPLPTPWSRKTGSESESEDSISHTETMSDASDYEVRIRQLSDELRRRRKEVEILKKERWRRKKEKFKAHEVALKKQLDAYNIYIQQLRDEKEDLEHEPPLKSAVRPQIKQPGVKGGASRSAPDAASHSSSFEDMREGSDSNQTSPSVDKKDIKLSPTDEKNKKKASVSHMDRISEGSESDKSAPSRKGRSSAPPNKVKEEKDVSEKSSSSMQEVIDEASQLDSVTDKTSSAAMKIKTSTPVATDKNKETNNSGLRSLKDDDASYSMDFSDAGSTLAQSHSRIRTQDLSAKGSEAGDISEHIAAEEPSSVASVPKSPASVSNQLKFDFKTGSKGADTSVASAAHSVSEGIHPSTGIQESDSETESRVNSYHTTSVKSEASSRPSSERSVGSMSYSAEDDDEENDQNNDQEEVIQPLPVKSGTSPTEKSLPPVPGASSSRPAAVGSVLSKATDDDISEHISASLPSISEKQGGSHSNSLPKDSQDILDSLLGYQEGERREEEDEDDKTPVPTPREMLPLDEDEEENLSLLMTDPLADFALGDQVLVYGGQKSGVLRYKGKVDFSPGIWAGVELDQPAGDNDGMQGGTRYFSCQPNHGVIVQGSDIMSPADREKDAEGADIMRSGLARARLNSSEGRSPDESLTTEDSKADEGVEAERTVLPARDDSMLHSTPLGSPHHQRREKPTATPVRRDGGVGGRNMSLLADSITDQLEASLVQESLEEVVGRLSNQTSPAKRGAVPPPLPSTPPPTSASPEKLNKDLDRFELPEDQEEEEDNVISPSTPSPPPPTSSKHKGEKTTDGVMNSLLNEAITDMIRIKKRKAQIVSHSSRQDEHTKLNGDLTDKDKQAMLSQTTGLSTHKKHNDLDKSNDDDDDDDDDDFYDKESEDRQKDSDSGLSLDHMQRPSSPVPGDTPTDKDRKSLNDDMADLFGEYIDDDLGFEQQTETAAKVDQQALENSVYSVPEDIAPVVPHTKDEITPIVSKAVDIFWTSRRYGESLDEVTPPADFLQDADGEEGGDDLATDQLTTQSRRSWKHMLFDLTGEVIRDIYQGENETNPPVWQKAQHKSHKFFKGSNPPTTVDGLRPLVQRAISDLLDLGGERSAGPPPVNKWNIRKKKDAVDAVLVSELAREEKGWVNYDDDELNLKMALADSLFDSLLADTVTCLNRIYQRRGTSQV